MEKQIPEGKKFSKDYQPPNRGRKPSKLRKYIKENNMASADVALIVKNIILGGQTEQQLKEILTDENKPMVIRLFVRAFLQDFKNGTLNNFETFMSRAFGEPTQQVNLTYDLSQEERDKRIKELWEKYNDGN